MRLSRIQLDEGGLGILLRVLSLAPHRLPPLDQVRKSKIGLTRVYMQGMQRMEGVGGE